MVTVAGTRAGCSGSRLANEKRLSKKKTASAAASSLARYDQVFNVTGKEPKRTVQVRKPKTVEPSNRFPWVFVKVSSIQWRKH